MIKNATHSNAVDSSEEEKFEKVVKINRVTKVCKGGKRLAFRALAIVGDLKGSVGISFGKAREVPVAIKQAVERANKLKETFQIINGTVQHSVKGKHGSAVVLIRPASDGTGLIAGGSVRILLEAAGFKNIVAKCLGSSNNPLNNALATLNALRKLKNVETEILKRNIQIKGN